MMKLLIFIVSFSLFIATEAVIEKPDEVIQKINGLKETVFKYQEEITDKISKVRLESGQLNTKQTTETLKIVEGSIQKIGATDVEVRAKITVQAQNACTKNLLDFVDGLIEISGYAISNCIEERTDSTSEASVEFTAALEALEKEAALLGEIILNALSGRNVFTQGVEIVARAEELLKEKQESLNKAIGDLKLDALTESGEETLKKLQTCYDETQDGVNEGLTIVDYQIPICERFGVRGGRSNPLNLPDPVIFFPRLRTRRF